jgi:hypothetical protein
MASKLEAKRRRAENRLRERVNICFQNKSPFCTFFAHEKWSPQSGVGELRSFKKDGAPKRGMNARRQRTVREGLRMPANKHVATAKPPKPAMHMLHQSMIIPTIEVVQSHTPLSLHLHPDAILIWL